MQAEMAEFYGDETMNLFRQFSCEPVVCHLDPSNYALPEHNALQMREFNDRQIFLYLGPEMLSNSVSDCQLISIFLTN